MFEDNGEFNFLRCIFFVLFIDFNFTFKDIDKLIGNAINFSNSDLITYLNKYKKGS